MNHAPVSPALLDTLTAPGAIRSPQKPMSSYSAPLPERAMRWDLKCRLNADDRAMGQQLGVSPVLPAVLRARGYSALSDMRAFLGTNTQTPHDPRLLPDIEVAVARLHRAVETKEPFLIFGDYDVDGLTSTAMLKRSLSLLGAVVEAMVPERSDGYGLNVRAVEAAHARGFRFILTVDNGVRAFDAIERARELGIDVVVTDHHEPDGARLPPALAIVNPKRLDSQYPFREICGCAVAYKLMLAYLEAHQPRLLNGFTEKYADFVAIATVADCMPLIDENRTLVRNGLRYLAKTKKAGLTALMEVARVRVVNDTLSGSQIGFALAPRLNAAGRLNQAARSLDLLLSTEPFAAQQIAQELEAHNRNRQEISTRIAREANDEVRKCADLERDCALVIARPDWPHGMMGLVASRLVEKHGRPAIVLGIDEDGTAHGSGRSIDNFDLGHILEATADLILGGGGHAGACGVHLSSDNIEAFRERVLQCTSQHLGPDDWTQVVAPDCVVEGTDLTMQLTHDLSKLEPCGKGFMEPQLALRGAKIVDGRNMGEGGAHLKWRIEAQGQTFDAIWWKPGERANGFGLKQAIDLCFVPQLNHFNGNTSLQLIIKAARPAA